MSAPADANKPTASAPESPTTARPLEMDDDDVQESGVLGEDGATSHQSASVPPASGDAPPPQPPRPMSEQQKNELMLKEAFPSVDISVIKAVLSASRGLIEPAFHALLEMTDPDAAKNEPEDLHHEAHEAPPPQPPRPQPGTAGLSQLEADELYARQLAEHYENAGAYEARTANPQGPRGHRGRPPAGYDGQDRERSFLDDDLPEIQENLRKGFLDTQKKFNSWFTNLKKKIDDSIDEPEQGARPPQQRRPGEPARRSGDYERYDADPQVLGDDFAGMKLSSDGTPIRPNRPLANPNLFRPPPPSTSPKPGDGRKVAFKDGSEDINVYDSSPRLPPKDGAAAKPNKWQPLTTVDPSPIADHDPFSLGDSEDEKDAKAGDKGIKMEDSERLKKAAAEAMADSIVDPKPAAKKD